MQAGNGQSIREPERQIPVYGTCDVLVVGSGPAGTAAAVAAAREGADVVLLERFGHLGGLSTGGLVFWIDRMADWDGNLLIGGIGQELVDRCGPEVTLGPPRELWGSRDPVAVAYWAVRTSAMGGVVQWSPTLDPEILKFVTNDIVREAGVTTLLHCWVVSTLVEDGAVRGVIFESKEGRFAVLAKVVVDCTGDGDIFAQAQAAYDDDFDANSAHARLTTAFRLGNVDMRRYLDFRMLNPKGHAEMQKRAMDEGIALQGHPTPHDSEALFMTPRMAGYSALKVADLTAVEFASRDVMVKGLAFYRAHVPGFERAWVMDTAQQIGTRHARRLTGTTRITIDHWRKDGTYSDSIGLCPGLTAQFPTLQIPYGSLVPRNMDGLLAAGRNLSADTGSHAALREIPECWAMGHAAGVAAAVAVQRNVAPRAVAIDELQDKLRKNGAIVDRPAGKTGALDANSAVDNATALQTSSIHWTSVMDAPKKSAG
ncbi:MAG: FAD-dependent oxidoreductase [Gammaproteobacteria bacterium]|nr:FAD-dependent oxidoreductase [Gammaproteobacteria bacterium]